MHLPYPPTLLPPTSLLETQPNKITFPTFYLYLQLNLRLGLGGIKPHLNHSSPPHGYYLYLSLSLSGKEWKTRVQNYLFFSDNDTDNKSWSGPLLLIWYELNDYVSDVYVWMCAFCYSFIFQIKVLNCLCLLFVWVF